MPRTISSYLAISDPEPVKNISATGNSGSVNTAGYDRALIILGVGDATGTSPTLIPKLQTSPDGSTGWADISGSALATFTDTGGGGRQVAWDLNMEAQANKFVRAAYTVAGTSPVYPLTVVAILYRGRSSGTPAGLDELKVL